MAKRVKGSVSPEMKAGRISTHGKITDLTKEFSISGGVAIALFIIEKASKSTDPVIVNCETFHRDGFADCPFTPNCWDVPAVRRIAVGGIDLTLYDVYWGAGAEVPETNE